MKIILQILRKLIMKSPINIKNGVATLCCGRGKCPELSFHKDGDVLIKDDDGFCVRINPDQAKLIPQAMEELLDNLNEK